MEDSLEKYDTVIINTYVNEIMSQTEVTQYYKNTLKYPIELELVIPQLSDINITRFEVIKKDEKIISKLLEKEKAKEKYTDSIASGNYSIVSFNSDNDTKICLGNLPSGEEIELKTYFFGHIISKDLSYQAKFPVIFPNFILENSKTGEGINNPQYKKKIVKGKIYLNVNSKITRLVICGSNNFSKIQRKYSEDKKSAEIDIIKDNFSEIDIPGIIFFRTEKINEDKLYYQYDPKKNKSYYLLYKSLCIPEFEKDKNEEIDENENRDYYSLLKQDEKENKYENQICYIFLLDQSGSMSGNRIELCTKSLLLFLQSLNQKSYFQLVGFGSNYEYFSEKPLEYNKTNIKNLMDIIKSLKADKGGTELYKPLENIYNNKIYEEYNMKKSIILLTDGEIWDKEKVINLIGSKSDEFLFNSLGIGDCDKDLIERTALMGKGISNYIKDLNDLNSAVISLLENNKQYFNLTYKTNQKTYIEGENASSIEKHDFLKYGFILDEKEGKDIEFTIIKDKKEEIKICFAKNKITKLPDGDKLGKLIVDNYLKTGKNITKDTIIKLSKNYNILTNETAFYAKIANDTSIKEKMITITNEGKQALNNETKSQPKTQSINEEEKKDYYDEIFIDEHLTYDYIEDEKDNESESSENKNTGGQKEGWFKGLISKLFSNDKKYKKGDIIKKKKYHYEYKEPKQSKFNFKFNYFSNKRAERRFAVESCCYYDVAEHVDVDDDDRVRDLVCENYCCDYMDYDLKDCENDKYESNNYNESKKEIKEETEIKYEGNKHEIKKADEKLEIKEKKKETKKEIKVYNFDELILGQDIIEGNWTNDSQVEMLIAQENDMFEKIKKLAESKSIKEENGIITLFVLYYIYTKKGEKVGELKFVIKKAKTFIKKIFNIDYEDIIKSI